MTQHGNIDVVQLFHSVLGDDISRLAYRHHLDQSKQSLARLVTTK